MVRLQRVDVKSSGDLYDAFSSLDYAKSESVQDIETLLIKDDLSAIIKR